MTLEALEKEAADLPEDQRMTLAHRILMSVEPSEDPSIGEAWDLEIRRRIESYEQGESASVSAESVFEEADRILGK